MNLLLFSDADRSGSDEILISDHRLDHLRQVLDLEPGEKLRLGELAGNIGQGEVVELNSKQARIAITALDTPPPPKLALDIVLALPRPKMLRRILRTVAECGVPRLHLINSYRVEKSYWQTPVLRETSLRDYLIQGLEQSRDTVLPEVRCHRLFKPFVEDRLPSLIAGKRALFAHPGDYPACPRDLDRDTVVVIGPEGGFIPYEVDKLAESGCQGISLGPRILRVETALTAVLGRLA